MTYLSVDEQDAAIRQDFPDFQLTAKADWIGVWEGPVRPAGKVYRIRIVYFRRTIFDGWMLDNPYVTVHVVDPLVGAEALQDKKFLPHIYWNDRNPSWPALCLWDPREISWTPEYEIAATIIPWASEWLFFFEYWQISGEFRGPGRHPDRRRSSVCPNPQEELSPEIRARQERFRNDEFHRIGRKTGVFGSYLSMGAALRDCSLRLYLQNLNDDIWAARQSLDTSIWSPGLRPAESLRSDLAPA